MKKLFLVLALVCAILSPARSATAPAAVTAPAMPDTVSAGFTIYAKNGYSAAIEAWSRGSSLEMDAASRNAITKSLSDTENTAGTFVSFELIKTVTLSNSSAMVYVFAKYQKGGLFLAFACSKPGLKWFVTSITANVDPAKVLPTNILSGS